MFFNVSYFNDQTSYHLLNKVICAREVASKLCGMDYAVVLPPETMKKDDNKDKKSDVILSQ